MYPSDYRYTHEHEWIRVEDDIAVLGRTAAAELFGEGFDAEGERVTIGDRTFTVAGVVRTTDDQDETVFIPLAAAQALQSIRHLHTITVSVEQAGEATRVAEEITQLLRERHAKGRQAPTAVGREALDEIEGTRRYLTVAEADRLRFHNPPERTPQHFEAMLPYAVALGVETDWTRQFADVLERAAAVPGGGYRPRWYHGSRFSGARLSDLGHTLGASYATAATPKSSSSGGGSRGGGSSGGGRGGHSERRPVRRAERRALRWDAASCAARRRPARAGACTGDPGVPHRVARRAAGDPGTRTG